MTRSLQHFKNDNISPHVNETHLSLIYSVAGYLGNGFQYLWALIGFLSKELQTIIDQWVENQP